MTLNWRERTLSVASGQSAYKDLRQQFIQPRYWFYGWVIATLLCTIIAPFETQSLSLLPRLFYWALMNGFSTLLMMFMISALLRMGFKKYWQIALGASLLFSLPYALALSWINPQFFRGYQTDFWGTWLDCLLIAFVIFALVALAIPRRFFQLQGHDTNGSTTLKLEKYPNAKVLALKAQDHYVEVITDQGSELLRTTLEDAIHAMNGVRGVQVHRSYWVARGAIEKFDKKQLSIALSDGSKIPVSKRRLQAFRKAVQAD